MGEGVEWALVIMFGVSALAVVSLAWLGAGVSRPSTRPSGAQSLSERLAPTATTARLIIYPVPPASNTGETGDAARAKGIAG
jgi:hypothetical protein